MAQAFVATVDMAHPVTGELIPKGTIIADEEALNALQDHHLGHGNRVELSDHHEAVIAARPVEPAAEEPQAEAASVEDAPRQRRR